MIFHAGTRFPLLCMPLSPLLSTLQNHALQHSTATAPIILSAGLFSHFIFLLSRFLFAFSHFLIVFSLSSLP